MKASKSSVPTVQATKKRRVKPWVIVLVAVSAVVAVTAGILLANADRFREHSQNRKIAAVCNGYEIPYEELRFITCFYKQELEGKYGEGIFDDPNTAESYREELETLVKENLNQNYVVLSAAAQLGIETSDSVIDNYVDEQIAALIEECGGKGAYKAFLAEQHMSENYLRFTFSTEFVKSAVHYTLLDKDIYEYRYEDNATEFMQYVLTSGNYVRTLHVYIENADGEDPAVNLGTAQKISDKLQSTAMYDERRRLLSEYIGSDMNDDLSTVTGDGYYFTRGEMIEAYENASFDLQIGEVSEPVVCGGGNFIIMRLEPEEAYVKNNAQELINGYYGVCLGEYIERFRPVCTVYFTDYGKTLDLLTID